MQQVDLSRFNDAHKRDFDKAYREISNGRKVSHWMWYIFPQVLGLGRSSISEYYAIKSINEAIAFLNDPYLGGNLRAICEALLKLHSNNATEVFGQPDDMKLRSSMTLFSSVATDEEIFKKVLDKFYSGKPDYRSLIILESIQN